MTNAEINALLSVFSKEHYILKDIAGKTPSKWQHMCNHPRLPGVYQRFDDTDNTFGYQYWNGQFWEIWSAEIKASIQNHKTYPARTSYYDGYWRGLL